MRSRWWMTRVWAAQRFSLGCLVAGRLEGGRWTGLGAGVGWLDRHELMSQVVKRRVVLFW